jgi:phosphopantetheine adenylyltransferase
MDYMFDPQMKIQETPQTIDGVVNENRFTTFTPNTIKYAVTENSPYGDEINKAKIGVAIHIEYMVQNGILKVKKYTSAPEEFSPSSTVFVFNVLANKPKNAKSSFSKLLLKDVQKKKNQVLKLADKVDFSSLDDYTALLKTYINSEIRAGRFLEDTSISSEEFVNWISGKFVKDIEKLKSEKGKEKKTTQMKNTLSALKKLKPSIKNAFEITKIIANLKNNLIKIFNEITQNDLLGTYLEDAPGEWQTTAPEGFALSRVDADGAQITKLVDRGEFSAANFGTGKPADAPAASEQESVKSVYSNPPYRADNFGRGGLPITSRTFGEKFNDLYNKLIAEDENTKTIALYPGGYKPPTKGHYHSFDYILQDADRGVIFIGKKERDGITAEQSKQIWEIYAKYLNKPVEVIISNVTPVKSVYDYADNNKDVNIIVGAGDKDDDVKRYAYFEKNIEKYPLVRVVKIPLQAEGISGTMTRELIASDIDKAIDYFTPEVLSTEDKANIKQILS